MKARTNITQSTIPVFQYSTIPVVQSTVYTLPETYVAKTRVSTLDIHT